MVEIKCPCGMRNHMETEDCKNTDCNACCPLTRAQTNADRIRAMSDEELARFLGGYKFCDICEEGCDNCTYHGDCDKRLLEWLRQPADTKEE